MDWQLLIAVVFGVVVLLSLILRLKVHPFLALLIASIVVGIGAGLAPDLLFEHLVSGIGGTLGFVATIVGLGAIMGAILEKSGGAASLASWMISRSGEDKAPWALMLAGFFVAIPVFFDVAFIILLPMAIAIKNKTQKPLLLYAMPLLAGLAITHAFIPPTPGPVAVADILGADIGWVILFGAIVGLPVAVVSGPILAQYVSRYVRSPEVQHPSSLSHEYVSPQSVLLIILFPITLVIAQTIVKSSPTLGQHIPGYLADMIIVVGHPFSALILANLLAWYFLGIRKGFTRGQLLDVSSDSFRQAGAIILLTGAGGGFKQILIETGAGTMIADSLGGSSLPPVLFCFVVATIVRVVQGSSTVAMVTAAGFTAPLIPLFGVSELEKAVLVIAIASGASMTSHVNDSGFWLVQQYLGLTEKQTFQTWTLMTTIIGLTGFIVCCGLMWLL
ncbi:gluconate transporter [Reichenbachiella sp. 5M10]|uniref:GntP family permease n=1 Tax=Reichenbachiella sp. 5M10 TaxID=1889772 RepID=UPI000C14C5AD|nr:gluconate:H+ symporter [Reichenbachiella sp. 5M10]PIB34322.1 gluconate transporter [Reichenbachiella sp. 5M10]